MPEMSRRDLAVTGLAAVVIVVGTEAGLLGGGHIVGLLFAYVVVSVASVAFGRSETPPTDGRKAALVGVVFAATAAPLAVAVAPPAGASWERLQPLLLVGGWALPVTLTVAYGVVEAEDRRRYIAAAHVVALLVLLASSSVAFAGTNAADLPGGGFTAAAAYYAVGVAVGYPAVLSYRRGLESA
jgi:hypothetical protein